MLPCLSARGGSSRNEVPKMMDETLSTLTTRLSMFTISSLGSSRTYLPALRVDQRKPPSPFPLLPYVCSFPRFRLLPCGSAAQVTLHSVAEVTHTPLNYFGTPCQVRCCTHARTFWPMTVLQHDVESPCKCQGGVLGPAASDVKGQASARATKAPLKSLHSACDKFVVASVKEGGH